MAEPRHTWTFHGGLRLADHKALSNAAPVQPLPIPARLTVPVQQHIGRTAEPVVAVGETVTKGQVIAHAADFVSANIHAPTSGRVTAVERRPIAHPSGLDDLCIVIETDGEDRWGELPDPISDYRMHDPSVLRERIRWAGVVGLGGAAFPTAVKTNTTGRRRIETLVVNAVECEPYITCDDRLMRERPDDIIDGIEILRHITGARVCLIGIEDNKPEAATALRDALAARSGVPAEVVVVPSVYPSGGEKQLIKLLTGKEVPSQDVPAAIGIVCQNVGTTAAIADAVLRGRPLIERNVTVTGRGVRRPGNFRVMVGTSAAHLVAAAGGYNDDVHKLILGGPMMGFALRGDDVPLTKAANCLLAATRAETTGKDHERPCIRCGACAEVCPAQLLPQQLYWHARSQAFDKVQDYHLFDCIECGCCAYVCPAHIPLVHYYRYAKTEIWSQERERRKADLARRRHDAREARQARLAAERQAKLRRKQETLDAPGGDTGTDPKKAAIEAAMKRVAAKKAAQQQQAETAGAGEE
jgi:Na+-translocating ferredoxin:NAD+ oxidoreductase subunit C